VNIYWGYANARKYDSSLCTVLEKNISNEASKISLAGAI